MQFSANTLLLAGLLVCVFSSTAAGTEERGMTFGVCVIAPTNTNAVHNVDLSPGRHLPELQALSLPNDVLHELNTGYPSARALERHSQWEDGLKVKIIGKPKSGSIFGENRGYRQNNNFIGKDKVELLVEGQDLDGNQISAKLIYFINIVPWEKYHGWANTKESFARHLKSFCGKKTERWRISNSSKVSGAPAPLQQDK